MLTFNIEGVHLTASLKKNPQALEKLRPSLAVARVLSHHMQERLKRGKTATPARPYAGRRRVRYKMSEAYARAAGQSQTEWVSSSQFHKRARAKPGYVTGGLVRSFRVSNVGKGVAMIAPSLSSLGKTPKPVKNRDAKIQKIRDDAEIQIKKRKSAGAKASARKRRDAKIAKLLAGKAQKVQNRFKAAALGREINISIVQPTTAEVRAMVSAVTGLAGSVVVDFFESSAIIRPSAGDPALLASLRQQFRKGSKA